MSFFIKFQGFVQKGAGMASNKESSCGLFDRARLGISSALENFRSGKFPVTRLFTSSFKRTGKKTRILKQKYSHSRTRNYRRNDSGASQLLAQKGSPASNKAAIPGKSLPKLTLPKFTLSKFTLPKLSFSKLSLPAIPKISIPKFTLNRFSLPSLSFNRYSASGATSKGFSLPGGSVPPGVHRFLNVKTAVIVLLIVCLFSTFIYGNTKVAAFALEKDGKQIAVVTDKEAAEIAIVELKAEKTDAWKRRVDVTQKIAFKKIQAKRFDIDKVSGLKPLLNRELTFVAVATGIKVNGEVAVVVKDEQEALDILEQLKGFYNSKEGFKVENIAFRENVELVDVPVALKEVLPAEDALRLLKDGREKKVTHVVESGESLWVIARNYDMHVEDLQKANPSLKGEKLDIGQELNLVAVEPLINVQVTGEITLEEAVPYKVVVKTNKSMWRGTEKVKASGENGLRKVTYRMVMSNGEVVDKEVLNEQVLKPVKDKVVERGTRIVVASRGGGGKIGWPISGKITSSYGRRWGRMHTGLDIDGYKGQPIGAAADGKVTSTGWEGAYGNMVTIKHDNGLVTRYAHLSKISVSSGDKVERGDLIGYVGSTGRSTGSHLHFEVLSGGKFQNPMNYLK
ncbi:MAG: hypothetical protein CVU89_05650 [Firmicutes bacterium HGW-Firmicutes-14]|nr:MAG: hypothetical protein CVU89_05650 [Firmicutes bacterium HGW-Firmicutes-14]